MIKLDKISKPQTIKIVSKFFIEHVDNQKFIFWCQNEGVCALSQTNAQKAKILSDYVYSTFMLDAEFIVQKDPSLNTIEDLINAKTKASIATYLYRIANFFYYADLSLDQVALRAACKQLMQECLSLTTIDIHPAAKIKKGFFIDHGANVVIGETCEIGEFCNLINNIILGSQNVINAKSIKRHPTLKDHVTVCAGARILGDITLGNNVFIAPYAVVLEDIEDDQKVIITNQLQLTKNSNLACLPSQKLVIYGVVPKYKNSLVIMGESFYNPTVLIKLKGAKTLTYQITYWDKNKIIIKIKNDKPFDKESVEQAKIIVLSNSNKVVLLNNIGLTKTLTNLSQ